MNIPLDILEAMEQEAAMNLRKSIDFEVIAGMLAAQGWIVVDIPHNFHNDEVCQWVNQTVQGQHQHHNKRWVFERESDAVLFKLKWA